MSRRLLPLVALTWALTLAAAAAPAADMIQEGPFIPATPGEAGRSFATGGATRVQVIADRVEYRAEDVNAQFLVSFLGVVKPDGDESLKIQLALKDANGRQLAARTVAPVRSPKLSALVPVADLKPGRYAFGALLLDKGGKALHQAAAAFTVSDRQGPRIPFPAEGVAVLVHPQGHAPDASWPISTGVPMPNALFRDVDGLALLEDGKPVPAQFSVRGTWGPGGYVKWAGLDFVAKYDKGAPRQYRVAKAAAARHDRPLKVSETADDITVDTGVLRFVVGRRFAGIEQAWLDRNQDGRYANDELVVSGKGGSFVKDQKGARYDSAACHDATVTVEDCGPLRATIAAKGDYADAGGKRLCRFIVRITAFAGQPFVGISHRTINTIADQWGDDARIADCGFEVVPAGPATQWRFGFDGAERAGAAPAAAASICLHQDRDNRLRLMQDDKPLAQGKRSDGWFSAQTGRGSLTLFLRDAWQKFPKEFEFDFAAGGVGRMVAHFWPKHGHQAFPEDEQLSRPEIHKVRWAHEGRTLEMIIPENCHKRLTEVHAKQAWALDGELTVVNKQGQTKMQASSGQGTAIGNDLCLWFHGATPTAADLKGLAGLTQQGPHALSDPRWNAATGVYGPIAPRDPARFDAAERLMDIAYVFYRRAIMDGGGDYGMWIYGAVHGGWDAQAGAPVLRRTWQQCHYQNIFQAWLLYLRSGTPDAYEWARIHSGQHMDVGVHNHLQYPPGKHSYSHIGEMGGSMVHCKGFMPWAGNASTMGHWIDVAHYFARYYLTGDRRGLDMADRWIKTLGIMGFPRQNVVPTRADGIQSYAKLSEADKYLKEHPNLKPEQYPAWIKEERAKPQNFNPREVLVPLGELVQYYQATWDPQALLYLYDHAEYLNLPFKDTQSPSLADFGKHWHEWYYALSRDPRVVERVREYMEEQSTPSQPANSASFAAFLYHATGEKKYLASAVNATDEAMGNIYDNPEDRYHGYSHAVSNPGAMILGRLPYLLHAVDAAGMKFERAGEGATLPTRGGRCDYADKALVPPRGWSNAGVTILGLCPEPMPLAVRVIGPRSYGSFRGFYQLFYDFPTLGVFAKPGAAAELARLHKENLVQFPGKTVFNDPPTQRNFTDRYGPEGANTVPLPIFEKADNDRNRLQYRLEMGGDNVDMPVLVHAETHKAIPQVAVISRTMYWNAKTQEAGWLAKGYMDCWFRPLDLNAKVALTLKGQFNRYGMTTTMRIWDAAGKPLIETSVLPNGLRKEATLTLDPAENPGPWRIAVASCGDCRVSFTGAEELFFAADKADFDKVLPHIPVHDRR